MTRKKFSILFLLLLFVCCIFTLHCIFSFGKLKGSYSDSEKTKLAISVCGTDFKKHNEYGKYYTDAGSCFQRHTEHNI